MPMTKQEVQNILTRATWDSDNDVLAYMRTYIVTEIDEIFFRIKREHGVQSEVHGDRLNFSKSVNCDFLEPQFDSVGGLHHGSFTKLGTRNTTLLWLPTGFAQSIWP